MLRSGIIIPFQFREHKKLLMIGGPEENRNLNLWDLKNVVRAAFDIYNFEFFNKKIGFNIPEDLLLSYLGQRHDLTNFVIEIRQANDEKPIATSLKDTNNCNNVNSLSFEPSCSNKFLAMTQKLTNSAAAAANVDLINLNEASPTNHSDHSSNQEPPPRRRGERMSKDQKEIYVQYFEENPCMLTQRRNDIALEPHWNILAALLNSVPQGAVKNVEEWKQTFDAWRNRVFTYTRYNSKLVGAAAQNHKNYKPLTATDQRAYTMWTSHKNTTPTDFEEMDMFASLDDYDY